MIRAAVDPLEQYRRNVGLTAVSGPLSPLAMTNERVRPVPNVDAPEVQDAPDLFRRYSPSDLLAADVLDVKWLLRGALCSPTYGMVAGPQKALKSTVARMVAVATAGAVPLFDRFGPGQGPAPVLTYVGEGGRIPYTRNMVRIARAMGLRFADLPIFSSFDVAPIGTARFLDSLERDLDETGARLFILDPLYSFHGAKTDSANLHQEGALLNAALRPCQERGVTFLICNHFNKGGSGGGLSRITMAGGGEWCDSWLLIDHRETPDVAAGKFQLKLDLGSRQWGGSTWHLDLHIGRFDEDTGEHDGDITWHVRRATGTATSGSPGDKDIDTRQAILGVLADRPGATKTDVFSLVKGNRERFHKAFNDLADRRAIAHDQTGKSAGKTGRPAIHWHLPEIPDQTTGPEWDADEHF
jgi:hypothetical protein